MTATVIEAMMTATGDDPAHQVMHQHHISVASAHRWQLSSCEPRWSSPWHEFRIRTASCGSAICMCMLDKTLLRDSACWSIFNSLWVAGTLLCSLLQHYLMSFRMTERSERHGRSRQSRSPPRRRDRSRERSRSPRRKPDRSPSPRRSRS